MSSTTPLLLYPPNPTPSSSPSSRLQFLSPPYSPTHRFTPLTRSRKTQNTALCCALKDHKWVPPLLTTAGVALAIVGPATAAQLPLLGSSVEFSEPANALSLPTWAVHVSSVVEWIIAMALVWQYGNKPGNEAWKGLSWGMVPLLGGAMCACTWHFFYNAESLEVLVALQAALTVFGNATMCIAAYRIYNSQSRSENS